MRLLDAISVIVQPLRTFDAMRQLERRNQALYDENMAMRRDRCGWCREQDRLNAG